MRRLVATMLVMCVAMPATYIAAQQQTPPTFRSTTTLVTVDVVVLDNDGKPVKGLTADDFQVKLNGKVQPVKALSWVQVAEQAAPLTATEVAPEEPIGRHVATNSAPTGESRVFVLMIDDLSFAPGAGKSLFASAARFVDRQPATDYIGFTSSSGWGIVNPTRDRALVKNSLRRLTGEFNDPRRPMTTSTPTVSIYESMDIIDYNDQSTLRRVIARECFGGDGNSIASQTTEVLISRNQCAGNALGAARMIAAATRSNTDRQVDAIVQTLRAMKPAKGLKQLVLMSQGIGVARNSLLDFEPIARAAAESGVQVSILVEEGDDLDLGDGGRSADNDRGESIGPPDSGLTGRRRDDQRMFRSAMQTLADASGGFFQTVIGLADTAFDRAAVAGSGLYRLGVEPPSDAPAGRAFSVGTSVKKSGVTVQANRTAVIPGPAPVVSAEEQMKAAIKEGQPLFNVPIRLAVALRRASAGQVELGIGLDVPSSVPGPLTMSFGLVSDKGELRTGTRPLAAPSDKSNYRFTFPMPVPAGRYQLRFAVMDASGSVGSIDVPVDAHLSTMGTLSASDVLTWWTDSTGKAQFLALDEVPQNVGALGAGIELYPQPGALLPSNVKVKMALMPVGKTVVAVEREVAPFSGGDMLRAEAMLPLADVAPGRYVLRATVTADGVVVGTSAAMITRR